MKNLPDDFLRSTERLFGSERFGRFLAALDEEAPVSIRLNPKKGGLPQCLQKSGDNENVNGDQVPWCEHGFYLDERPAFTFDPLLHAGCYYVQEAASMFIHHVLRHFVHQPVVMLDLCAAPGGKSTCARSALPEGSLLVSNEPIRNRFSILSENIQKWGYADSYVTNVYPRDYRRSKLLFDVILTDVPCSGEGMFRKEPNAISEWSTQNVERCWRLQRDIVADAWQCLRPGGLLIYSTCTFNTLENEENVRWMTEEFGAKVVEVPTLPDWGITGSLLEDFHEPVYRFIPGLTRSEGLFVAVLRKQDGNEDENQNENENKNVNRDKSFFRKLTALGATEAVYEPLSIGFDRTKYPCVELSFDQAIAYLRREALVLPADTPRGQVVVMFRNHPLGFAKNIGTRANNQYPQEWRIRTTHVPSDE